MVSSGMLRRVALVRTDVSEVLCADLVFLRSVRPLLVTASVVPSSPIPVTLMTETSVLSRATRRNSTEDTILHRLYSSAVYSFSVATSDVCSICPERCGVRYNAASIQLHLVCCVG
jgi:hypothetical protein